MLPLRLVATVMLFAAALAGCQRAAGGDVLQYPPPPGWGTPGSDYVVGYKNGVPGRYSIIEWIRRGDSIDNWNELITTEDWSLVFVRPVEGSVGQYVAKQQRTQENVCPGLTRWNLVRRQATDVIYEAWFAPCPALAAIYRGQGNESLARIAETPAYEVARIFDGKTNRFRLAYTIKRNAVSTQERNRWLAWLDSVRLAQR